MNHTAPDVHSTRRLVQAHHDRLGTALHVSSPPLKLVLPRRLAQIARPYHARLKAVRPTAGRARMVTRRPHHNLSQAPTPTCQHHPSGIPVESQSGWVAQLGPHTLAFEARPRPPPHQRPRRKLPQAPRQRAEPQSVCTCHRRRQRPPHNTPRGGATRMGSSGSRRARRLAFRSSS